MVGHKSLLSGIGIMAILITSAKLVRFIILMVTARFLTPEDFGVVAVFSMIFAFAYLVADMGIIRTIIQRPEITDKHVGSAFFLSVSICLLLCIFLFLSSDSIARLFKIDEIALPLKISSLIFLILGITNICSALFQRNGNVLFIGKVQAFGTIMGNIFITVPLLFFDVGYWSIIIGLWISELISLMFILFFGWKSLRYRVYKKELFEIVKYGVAFFSNNTLGLLSQQLDVAIISRYMGTATLGHYSRAMQLVDFPNQIYIMVVDRIVFPIMSAMKSERDKLSSFFLESISVLSFVLAIGSINIIIGAKEIVLIMMGSGWGQVATLFQILALCIVFRALSSFMDSFLAAYDLVKILTIKQVFSLVLLMLGIWAGFNYGVIGIAYGVVFASFLRFTLTVILIVKNTKVSILKLLTGLIPALLSSFTILFFYLIMSQYTLFNGLIGIVLTTAMFFVFCFFKPNALFLSENGCNFLLRKKTLYLS